MSDSQQWRKPKVQFEESQKTQELPRSAVAGGRAQQFAGTRKSLLKKNASHNKSALSIQAGASDSQEPRQRRISLPDSTTAPKAQHQATQPLTYEQGDQRGRLLGRELLRMLQPAAAQPPAINSSAMPSPAAVVAIAQLQGSRCTA
eukprot:2062-Heterococcus_DN1.PRE.1